LNRVASVAGDVFRCAWEGVAGVSPKPVVVIGHGCDSMGTRDDAVFAMGNETYVNERDD
jgi:hypothetical protein